MTEIFIMSLVPMTDSSSPPLKKAQRI